MNYHSIDLNVSNKLIHLYSLKRPVRDFESQELDAPQTGRFCLLHRRVRPRISQTRSPAATNQNSKEEVEALHTFRQKIRTQMNRVAGR